MNNDKIASDLSEALVAVLNGDKARATKFVADALRGLTGSVAASAPAKPGTPKPAKNLKKRATDKRGRGPALRGERVQEFTAMVKMKMRPIDVQRHFGISGPTYYKYLAQVRATALQPVQETFTSVE